MGRLGGWRDRIYTVFATELRRSSIFTDFRQRLEKMRICFRRTKSNPPRIHSGPETISRLDLQIARWKWAGCALIYAF